MLRTDFRQRIVPLIERIYLCIYALGRRGLRLFDFVGQPLPLTKDKPPASHRRSIHFKHTMQLSDNLNRKWLIHTIQHIIESREVIRYFYHIIEIDCNVFLFAFATNYIGYGGKMNLLAYVTTIAFALSLIANALNALKLTTQWGFWLIYNFVQLTKAGIQGNFANIGKYIFYILNAIGALFVWNDEEVK